MGINVVHRYSYLGEKFLRTAYNALGVKFIDTLQVCGVCARSKAKAHMVRKKTYTKASQPGESVFLGTTGPCIDIFIGNRYWISIVNDYRIYSCGLFTKTNYQLPKNMADFFEKMTSRGNPVKYIRCNNAGEHQSKLQRAY